MKFRGSICVCGILMVLTIGAGLLGPAESNVSAAQTAQAPQFKVDPNWPKPLPTSKDAKGVERQWVTGQVGGTCVDSRDHVFALNRAFQEGPGGGMFTHWGGTSIPAPPVIEYDSAGNIVHTWGDPTVKPMQIRKGYGTTAVMPESLHGCFVDFQENVWIGGYADGVVQEYTHDGEAMLLQIGTKGLCDGPQTMNFLRPNPGCGTPGYNSSHTLLNEPADIAVDPGPDPVSGQAGDVYIADGYGNHRIVVFDSKGKYLRQFGSAGSGDGQFHASGGGHPHCVVLGNDNLIYVCDRGNHRVEVFDKLGNFRRNIYLKSSGNGASDLAFSPDESQRFMYVCEEDGGKEAVLIVDHATGAILGGFGPSGHGAGEFSNAHTLATDSEGNIYVAETGNGRRIQKFVPDR